VGLVGTRCPKPQRHECDSHDGVSGGDHCKVAIGERRRHTGRQHQSASHAPEHQEPVGAIIGVVGRCHPCEVHPGPPDRKEDHPVPKHALADDSFGQPVVKRTCGRGNRHHKDEVKEELERSGRPMFLSR
jgi:hypothetical protein